MGFNKKFISDDVSELKKQYIKIGHDEFRKRFLKYEVTFYSHPESMIFIQYVAYGNRKYIRFIYEILRFLKIIR